MEDRGRESALSDFGALLRRYRLAAGLSQESLAERARLSLYGISALERGYRRTPQRDTLEMLAGALALNDEQRLAFEVAAVRPTYPRRRDRSPVAVGPWPSPGGENLPFALTRFVGREAEIEEIAALMNAYRLVTITGTGGIGKTQAALRVVNTLSVESEGRICFVGLAPISDPSLVAMAIASALGVQEVPDHPLLETLITFLKNKITTLLIDNCEHVVEQAAVVSQALLTACPGLRMLATSRQTLRAAGERAYRLPSLDEEHAIELFVSRAQAADAHFELNDENQLPIAEICRRLDGIPLAIELAAARVNVLPPRAMAEKLDDCFRILAGGERTALPRQKTMRGAIDWSYGLLSEPEQRLFERLSTFAIGCSFETAVSVCADDTVLAEELLRLLCALVEKSLVIADFQKAVPRYRLLEPFRQYARERLSARGEHEIIAGRQAATLLSIGEQLLSAWDTAAEPAWYQRVEAEIADWRAVLEWSLGHRSDIPTGQRLIRILALLTGCNPPAEWQRWVALARELAGPDASAETLAALSYGECVLRSALDQHELNLACATDALARYRALGDELGVIRSEFQAARALFSLGRHSEGEPVVLDAIARARHLGLRKILAVLLEEQARSGRERGEFSLARSRIAEARAIYLAVGAATRAGHVMESLARCELYEGKPEVAAQRMFEVIPTYRAIGDMCGYQVELAFTAHCLLLAGDFDRAESCAREALAISAEHQIAVGIAVAIHRLIAIALFRGRTGSEGWRELCERSARLFGFVNATLAANGSPRFLHDTKEYDAALKLVRSGIPDDIDRLMHEGAAMTEDQAVAEASAL
jgi:predicted ATPase/DNA-binding XRE family transcriptional regulator